jgi:hypothetical protein
MGESCDTCVVVVVVVDVVVVIVEDKVLELVERGATSEAMCLECLWIRCLL